MGARGGLGLTVELDRVPQRETGMTSYEIMLSESQERMLLVADKERAIEVLDVFSKWGLDAAIVGEVTAEPRMRITQGGVLVADIPNQSLTDDAPVYRRPVGEWKAPVPMDPPAHVLEELKKPRDYTADLKKLLASANICDKRWVYEQYDSMVQTNTVQGPGGEAGVMRIKDTGAKGTSLAPTDDREKNHAARERGLAMALAGNGRWCYLDPKLGAMHAVAEAARKVACTGATPVAATNCLNFGNPEKPEIMAQLSAAIDGIAEACTALGTPITGGNVSLYNETKGVGIYPTPVVGVVGIIDDVTKAVPASFQKAGDVVLFVSSFRGGGRKAKQDMGSTDWVKSVLGETWGVPPVLTLKEEADLHKALGALAEKGLLKSACDLSDGGCAIAFAKACFPRELGVSIAMRLSSDDPFSVSERLFSEIGSSVIATADPTKLDEIQVVMKKHPGVGAFALGEVTDSGYEVKINDKIVIGAPLTELKSVWGKAIEDQLTAEVVTA
jgi:phosphoribosylformylglycinamidine synthase